MRGFIRNMLSGLAVLTAVSTFGAMPSASAADEQQPQELQASVQPARRRVIPEGYYPATRVVLPESMRRNDDELVISAPWFHNFADGNNDVFGTKAPRTTSWYDHFAEGGNDIFGGSLEDNRVEREAKTDDEGYLIFGGVPGAVGSSSAYAMLLPPDMEDECVLENGDGARLPKAFSFESDDSPLILAEITSPGSDGTEIAVRRQPHLRLFSGRRPAEIIEREPYNYAPYSPDVRPDRDTPAMVPPADGKVRRAQIKLPTSSQGLGMASGFIPGR